MAKRIYPKTVRELFFDLVSELKLKPGEIIERSQIINWFRQKYPKIKTSTVGCHCFRLATNAPSRIHYQAGPSDDLLFQLDAGRYRLYDSKSDPAPIYLKAQVERSEPTLQAQNYEENDQQEFAYEKDLQQFLAKNLELIEPGLQLYKDDEDDQITGFEFPAGDRFIDILATDKSNDYVVVELKVSKGYDRVVGQLLRYMAWIKENLASENQKVRGVIVAREISEDLRLATSLISNVTLLEYELKVKLNKVIREEK
jgi:Endonuclease NucS C-terminal domain